MEILHNDLIGLGMYVAYFVAAALLALFVKRFLKMPTEVFRKMLHLVITLSILPLLKLFSAWYIAVLAAFLFVLIIYPILTLVENTTFYKQFAPERSGGEFKKSLLIVQLSFALLIIVFWGALGIDYHFIAVVAVMAWGFGDAAAALVGKSFGRYRILHKWIEGVKTAEGVLAMHFVAGLAIFLTLLIYAGQSWQMSLAIAAFVAPVSAVVELFSNRGMDTLTVPLSVAFLILPLMFILSLFGL